MLLSIIVPVYNVEKYLERCIDSLLDQGEFTDYEIILVNDGSTDSSPAICEKYRDANEKVRVLHKENGGAAAARNAGIRVAKGEYIMFVDSDDYIRSNCLEVIVARAIETNADIVSYDFIYIYEKKYCVNQNTQITDIGDKVITGKEYLSINLTNRTMLMTVWKNIYKRDLIVKNNIYFVEGYIYEDEEWVPRIFYEAKRVCQQNEVIYAYLIRPDSVSNYTKNLKVSLDLIEICKRLKTFTYQVEPVELRHLMEDYIVTLSLSAYYRGKLITHIADVLVVIDELFVSKKNKAKIKLFKLSPRVYLLINNSIKKVSRLKKFVLMSFKFIKKCCDFGTQKAHIWMRKVLVCKKQKRELKNHSFSLFSSTCNGGVITSELGERFRSPTVNLYIRANEFVKMINNLQYYMNLDVIEVENNFYPYPVGKIGDITVYFMHYHTFEEAKNKWNQRKKRINYDNLFFMMAERDGCSSETVRIFDELPYGNKVIFTKNFYPQYKSTIWVKENSNDEEVTIMTDYVGMTGRKYDAYLDYVKWLNGESI